MTDDQVGGNPSRCDGCTVFEHCAKLCEDCEEKTTGACVDGCPMDCGVLGDGDGDDAHDEDFQDPPDEPEQEKGDDDD